MATAVATSPVQKCATKGCVFLTRLGDPHCTFKIQNERAYSIAKAISTLQPDHALKVRAGEKKGAASLASSVVNYGQKMNVFIRHRKAPGAIYFWKSDKPKK